jgi:hypothetical protein
MSTTSKLEIVRAPRIKETAPDFVAAHARPETLQRPLRCILNPRCQLRPDAWRIPVPKLWLLEINNLHPLRESSVQSPLPEPSVGPAIFGMKIAQDRCREFPRHESDWRKAS